MLKALESLVRELPPPINPSDAQGDWESIENRLGLTFPEDYKEFVSVYGSGVICGFLTIYSPFSSDRNHGFEQQSPLALGNLRRYREEGFDVPYPIHPEESGLLPFGTTENFNYLAWSRVGSPAKWPIVVWDTDYLQCRAWSKKGLAGFLLDVVTQNTKVFSKEEFPLPLEAFDLSERRFVPLTEVT
jgi:hypothetical protein